MIPDARGLALTTRFASAAERFDRAVEDFLEFRPELPESIQSALAFDGQFVMANVLAGVVLRLASDDTLLPGARKHLATAQTAASSATPREQAHVEALRWWLAGDLHAANRVYEALLKDTPQDLLALKFLTHNYFWLGDRTNLRDAPARVLHKIDESLPGYGYILGAYAFGFEECGEYKQAERNGLKAVEMNPGDLWAIHAVAHVYEMQCRVKEGLDWIERFAPSWTGRNTFVYHLWWHRALLLFELEQWDAVLALYDGQIRKDKTEFAMDFQNAASLLWRLELRGVKVGSRWDELADIAEKRTADLAHPFNSLHFMMSMLRGSRTQGVETHLEAMVEHAEKNRPPAPIKIAGRSAGASASRAPGVGRAKPLGPTDSLAAVFEDVAIPVCEGLTAFNEGVFTRATERLMKGFGKLQSIGGSHAQRDVIVLTLIQAARDGGYMALARDLLAARTHTREGSADAWHTYARVLELSRDLENSTIAKARGDALANKWRGAT